jgi:fatty acid desaturase
MGKKRTLSGFYEPRIFKNQPIWPRSARSSGMRSGMKDKLAVLLLLLITIIVLWFILSRLMIVVFIPVSFRGAVLFVLVLIVAIFLVLDHFLDLL